jgi:hypothetical protein
VFPHKDDGGFNIMLQALPLDGKIVCRERRVRRDGEGDPLRPHDDRRVDSDHLAIIDFSVLMCRADAFDPTIFRTRLGRPDL